MDRIDARPASSQAGPLSAAAAERLDRLFRLYSARVLAYAMTRAHRPEDAHDIAGETWAKACRCIAALRASDDHAMPWLASTVRTVAIDFYRPKRSTEEPADWTDAVASRPLPASPAAETETDVLALAELTVPEARVLTRAAPGLTQSALGAPPRRHPGPVSRH